MSWKTKNEIIKDIGVARLDIARRPKVKRVAPGKYLYTVKNCDTGRYDYGSEYEIVKLTPENIKYYQKMLDDTLESGDDLDD